MKKAKPKAKRPVVEVMHRSYRPSKAEMEADATIPTTPEKLARAIGRQVTVKEQPPKKL